MQVQRRQGVSVYCLSNGATIPEWMGDRAKRNLSKIDDRVRHRVELLQDFQFPAASSKIVQSSDGRYIIAAGIYPPRIRCYDIHDLSMKFERYVTSEIVDLCCLGTDYGKLAILQDDRTVAIHAHYGAHASVRIPHFGRAMVYESTTCEALIASSTNLVYRLNLEEGRFMAPWEMDVSTAAGVCIALHGQQPLAAVGCNDGTLRCWDTRRDDPAAVLNLNVGRAVANKGYGPPSTLHEITSVNFDQGWYMGVGTAHGVVALYDIRSSKPVFVQEHKNGTPIHTVLFHDDHVISSDSHIIKAWQYKTDVGKVLVNIEGTGKLTSCMVASDDQGKRSSSSGLLLCATDQPKMDAFYVPALGVAPAWCSFLDNITEELEETSNNGKEGTTTVFDNYKFVSREELERLGITNLIGTPMLKAYMHGFFIDTKLYQRVQAVKEPDSYEQYRKAKIKENMAAKSRISEQRAPPTRKITTDARFGDLLTNPDFEVDEQTEDFRLRHPSGVSSKRQRAENFDSDEEKEPSTGSVAAEEEEIENADLSDDSSDEDSVGFRKIHDEENDATEKPSRISGQIKRQAGALKAKTSAPAKDKVVSSPPISSARNRKLTLEETDDDVARMDRSDARRTLAERVSQIREEELANPVVRINESGKKEVTFIPKSKSNSSRDRDDRDGSDTRERHERRGIKELGLRRQPMWEGTGRGAGRGRGRGAGRGRGRGRGSSR